MRYSALKFALLLSFASVVGIQAGEANKTMGCPVSATAEKGETLGTWRYTCDTTGDIIVKFKSPSYKTTPPPEGRVFNIKPLGAEKKDDTRLVCRYANYMYFSLNDAGYHKDCDPAYLPGGYVATGFSCK